MLSRDEFLRLLGQATFGRVAITVGALPMILPVNYRLVGDKVVVRTSPGSKLEAAKARAVVSFEVDSIEPLSHASWSVIVTGRLLVPGLQWGDEPAPSLGEAVGFHVGLRPQHGPTSPLG